ncbi:hypothetical protein AB685_05390 [Bacillus sp. LL01]|nr:hypothetical protein AB685_05390 [Bacillus sp. LL01]
MHETEHPPAVSGDQNEGINDGTIGTCLHTDQKLVLRSMRVPVFLLLGTYSCFLLNEPQGVKKLAKIVLIAVL